jgi:hypothetical protein
MKNLLYLLLLIPCALLAQTKEYGDFKIETTEIVYQKTQPQDSITIEKLTEFLETVPGVSNIQRSGGAVTADLTDLTVDFKKFKFAQVNTPPIIQTGKYSGKITMAVKEGKYRTTVNALTVKGDIGYKKITNPEPLTNYACTNSGTIISRDWCKPTMLGLLNQAFTDRLQYVKQKKASDW